MHPNQRRTEARGPKDTSFSFSEQLTSLEGRNMNHAKISCHFNCIRNTGGFVIPFDRLFFPQSHIISSTVFLLHNILHAPEWNPAHGYRKPLDQPVFLYSSDPCLSAVPKQIRKTVQTQEKQIRSKSLTEKELKSSAPQDWPAKHRFLCIGITV